MDLPWNPAVLEQRAARIHRLGQQRPIRVIHFVARGTIEEGMLSVLAFKRSSAHSLRAFSTAPVPTSPSAARAWRVS